MTIIYQRAMHIFQKMIQYINKHISFYLLLNENAKNEYVCMFSSLIARIYHRFPLDQR